MLHLSGTLRNTTTRITPLSAWRVPTQQLIAACSGRAKVNPEIKKPKETSAHPGKKKFMVKTVFETLKVSNFGPETSIKTTSKPQKINISPAAINLQHAAQSKADKKLDRKSVIETVKVNNSYPKKSMETTSESSKTDVSQTVDNLLDFAQAKDISRETALTVVNVLIDLVNNQKAKLSDFEKDYRFVYLCTLVSETPQIPENKPKKKIRRHFNDLSLFTGRNEVNEATKEVANITVSQMIKVMLALATQKRRSMPLLRSLSYNISRSPDRLDIKALSDLLYSMSRLNYPDEVLLQKISSDLIPGIKTNTNTAVFGSIVTSLGMLRYKNTQVLDELSEWATSHTQTIRAHDLSSLFLTLATVNYTPTNAQALKDIIESLNETDMTQSTQWLDIVWALTVLDLVPRRHIESVLNSDFIRRISDPDGVPDPKKIKLLNINSTANLIYKDYKGPFLDKDSEVFKVNIVVSKDKQIFVKAIIRTLETMFTPESIKPSVDLGMGFLLDAEFFVDRKGECLPLGTNVKKDKAFRIAVLSLHYHDYSRGETEPLGYIKLCRRLLEAKGYTILCVPHTEFKAEDKIIERMSFIKNRIADIVK